MPIQPMPILRSWLLMGNWYDINICIGELWLLMQVVCGLGFIFGYYPRQCAQVQPVVYAPSYLTRTGKQTGMQTDSQTDGQEDR